MLFNNISKEQKMEILQENLPEYEKELFSDLIFLGINPYIFTFADLENAEVDENDLATKDRLDKAKKVFLNIEMINSLIDSLE